MKEHIEDNEFNREWLLAGRTAGFTDEQLKFLEDFHLCQGHDCPYTQ